mmetsp:Transcript_33036/g.73052  ORF Transcript_33036/g.73052 Transcript_33036/m.73052 type:complete len:417 (+) Transcript_33036:138-1388(+)|eukprot:CAMPEP_0202912726 /NCGR_PEP_ID=MMETSP1392-20130828/58521_1 /ASSEMBLY_ACC=CAM_ASM_000868 /TAXON_ID=225041 /ORGANISM="Chlamydomonas chlamydogama, Strain SAG 11-48b" /LENGTH=416 /DNA_ID=CAMNT_0049603739 /DNA_START=85 /DNA_END=1335 /DNA_ORIENTATION=+
MAGDMAAPASALRRSLWKALEEVSTLRSKLAVGDFDRVFTEDAVAGDFYLEARRSVGCQTGIGCESELPSLQPHHAVDADMQPEALYKDDEEGPTHSLFSNGLFAEYDDDESDDVFQAEDQKENEWGQWISASNSFEPSGYSDRDVSLLKDTASSRPTASTHMPVLSTPSTKQLPVSTSRIPLRPTHANQHSSPVAQRTHHNSKLPSVAFHTVTLPAEQQPESTFHEAHEEASSPMSTASFRTATSFRSAASRTSWDGSSSRSLARNSTGSMAPSPLPSASRMDFSRLSFTPSASAIPPASSSRSFSLRQSVDLSVPSRSSVLREASVRKSVDSTTFAAVFSWLPGRKSDYTRVSAKPAASGQGRQRRYSDVHPVPAPDAASSGAKYGAITSMMRAQVETVGSFGGPSGEVLGFQV